jgi:fibronectin-binding autotransporter adhesin
VSSRCPLFLTPCLLLFSCSTALATDYTWNTAATSNWNTPGNWSPSGIPALGDNVTIDPSGTYTVNLNGDQSATNVLLNSAGATVNAFGSNFNLGGTMALSAGNWVMGGFMGTPVTLSGGTITRSAGDTGKFVVEGDLRLVNTQVANAAAVELSRTGGGRLRLSGTSAFSPGSVITMANTGMPYPSQTGITFEEGGVVDNLTVNLGQNTTVGTVGGQSLTFGPNTVIEYADPHGNFTPAAIGREFYESTAGIITLTNQGTIRALGDLYVGRYTDVAASRPNVDLTNTGLIESRVALTVHVNTFTNAPGGVLRTTAGGTTFLHVRDSWVNQGTFEVSDGGELLLGGHFTRAAIGTVVRSGTNTVGLYASRMDNTGGTWALNAATGSYRILSESGAYSEIIGGAITAADGAKLQVRKSPASSFSPIDTAILTGVQVGAGVLDFAELAGKLLVRGGTTFTPGDTIALAGGDTALQFLQTSQVDGVTFVLSGERSALTVWDDNTLTLGPTTTVRKTGAAEARLNGETITAPFGTPTAIVNRGLIHVQQGTLQITGLAGFTFTNRGAVQVDTGATVTGFVSDGGTVTGGGTIAGSLNFTGSGNLLRPGASPGTLTVTGNLSLNSGTTLHAELNGNTPSTGHDQLAVTGTISLGNAELDLTLGGGYTPAVTDKLFLITNSGDDAISGEFANKPHLSQITIGGYLATISYFGNSTNGTVDLGNDVVVYNFTPVPEPGAILAVVAAAGLGGGLWQRVGRYGMRRLRLLPRTDEP